MSSILSVMDRLHHFRTWSIPQTLRRIGVLSEGWEPHYDRYVHRFMGCAYKKVAFFSTQDMAALIEPVLTVSANADKTPVALLKDAPKIGDLPFYSHAEEAKATRPFVLTRPPLIGQPKKAKYVVHSPVGKPRFFTSVESLATHLASMRSSLLAMDPPRYRDSTGVKLEGARYVTGAGPSSILVIENLSNGKRTYRSAAYLFGNESKLSRIEELAPIMVPRAQSTALVLHRGTVH